MKKKKCVCVWRSRYIRISLTARKGLRNSKNCLRKYFFYSYVDPIHSCHLTWQLNKEDLDLRTLAFRCFLCPIFYGSLSGVGAGRLGVVRNVMFNVHGVLVKECWYIAVDTLSTLDSLFSSIPPYCVVRDSGT
jgi:hypothetical protein